MAAGGLSQGWLRQGLVGEAFIGLYELGDLTGAGPVFVFAMLAVVLLTSHTGTNVMVNREGCGTNNHVRHVKGVAALEFKLLLAIHYMHW